MASAQRAVVMAVFLLPVLASCGDPEAARRLERDIAALRAENASLTADLAGARGASGDSASGVSRLTEELAAATGRVSDLLGQVEAAASGAAAAQARYEEAVEKLDAAQQQIVALQDSLDRAVGRANEVAAESKAEIDALRTQVADLTAKLAAAVKAIESGSLRDRLLPPK